MEVPNESTGLNESSEEPMLPSPPPFYNRRRHLIYTGLLLFVVVAGLPIVGVPYLRNRLSARILMLKAAMHGEIKPAVAEVGANPEPFPAEYERPEPSVPQAFKLPPADKVYTMAPGGYVPPPVASKRVLPEEPESKILTPKAESGESPAEIEAVPETAEESGPEYKQGENEQEAYDLLLKSSSTIAGMVQGSNPSLRFESWGAAYRGDDIYWVRLKFQSDNNSDMDYIWQVKLSSKEITPLSYNARSIS